MAAQTAATNQPAKRPPERVPLTHIRRIAEAEAHRADARGNHRLAAAIGGGEVQLTDAERAIVVEALGMWAKSRAQAAGRATGEAEQFERDGQDQAAAAMAARAKQRGAEADTARVLLGLVADAAGVTVSLAQGRIGLPPAGGDGAEPRDTDVYAAHVPLPEIPGEPEPPPDARSAGRAYVDVEAEVAKAMMLRAGGWFFVAHKPAKPATLARYRAAIQERLDAHGLDGCRAMITTGGEPRLIIRRLVSAGGAK